MSDALRNTLIHSQTDIDIDRALSHKSFFQFLRMAWPYIDPASQFIPAWHVEAICEHVQAVIAGDLKRLIINVPPGSTKSISCCVGFPAWTWTEIPEKKFIFGSYSDRISGRDGRRTKRLVQSDWYQQRWGDEVVLSKDEQSILKFSNTRGGFRLCTTIAGGVTGEHADVQVVDDPVKPFEIGRSMHVAKTALDAVLTWWNETMTNRVTTDDAARIIIMQRLHESDLAGEMAKTGDYELLMLPMEYEKKRCCVTSIGFEDPRTEEKELLCPARFSAKAVAESKKALGPRGAEAQMQQNPTPAAGNIIKTAFVRYYKHQPKNFTTLIQSWDCAFKNKDTSDFVCGQIWGALQGKFYLVDQILERLSFTETMAAIKMMTSKWPKARAKLIEDKANGTAVMDALQRTVSGMIPIEPEGGKEVRLYAVEPLWAAGNVLLPHPENCPWIGATVENIVGFPSKPHDDDVDAMSQALVYLESKSISRLKEAMANVK